VGARWIATDGETANINTPADLAAFKETHPPRLK
jgi:hypothetical protein